VSERGERVSDKHYCLAYVHAAGNRKINEQKQKLTVVLKGTAFDTFATHAGCLVLSVRFTR